MIKYYVNAAEGKITETTALTENCWIYMEAPTPEEVQMISGATGVREGLLNTALDEEEAAHIDYEGDVKMFIIDIPKMTQKDGEATIFTMPLAMIQKGAYFISVCLTPTTVLGEFFVGKVKNIDVTRKNKLIYQIMYNNFIRFLFYLKRIDRASDTIQKSLAKSMQNKELLQLFGLQKSLVFFSASLAGNKAVVQKMANQYMSKSDEDERGLLEDVIIEAGQAIEMCSVYREILKSTMDAFASVVNNNQNIVMKFLTAVTIILSIPMLMSGFWGMNTGVPFETEQWGFWVVVALSAAFSAILVLWMWRKKMF